MAVCPPAICLTFHFSRPIKRSSRSAAHQMFAYLLATFNLHATSLPCPWFSIKVLSCYQVSHRWQCFGIKSRASAGGRKMSNADVSTLVRSSKRKLELITIDLFSFQDSKSTSLSAFYLEGRDKGGNFPKDMTSSSMMTFQYGPDCHNRTWHKSDAAGTAFQGDAAMTVGIFNSQGRQITKCI